LGGVRIEDDVVVNSGGCTVLNAFPKNFDDMIVA
jgi:Xaa-Pro aminopeptidase